MGHFFCIVNIIARYLYQYIRPKPSYYHRVKTNGLNRANRRENELVVSLTSFPARAKAVSYTIESILSQEVKPDRVVLWLAGSQFPNKEKDLPRRLLRLRQYGLEIRWTTDIRSFKKLIPALQTFPDAVIVTADDDVYYPPTWLGGLYADYLRQPDKIHCNRGNRIQFNNETCLPEPYNQWGLNFLNHEESGKDVLMTGVGGVLYPPHSLFKDVCREDLFMTMARDADDIWFWAMAALQGTAIKVVKDNQNDFDPVFIVNAPSLWSHNVQGNNDKVFDRLFSSYPELKKIFQYEI